MLVFKGCDSLAFNRSCTVGRKESASKAIPNVSHSLQEAAVSRCLGFIILLILKLQTWAGCGGYESR